MVSCFVACSQIIDGDGGFAVGVFRPDVFSPLKCTLGVQAGSWCLSRTGKRSDGSGFTEFTERFAVGDVIVVEVDMKLCVLWLSRLLPCCGVVARVCVCFLAGA